MKCISRFKKYRDSEFDKVLMHIRDGTIKAGTYAHLVKVDKSSKLKGGVYFEDDTTE